MSVQLTIRNVPEKVRDELAARAALQGKSMQEFLRNELERIASRPSLESWLSELRDRKKTAARRVPPKAILKARDADRK
jgi:plasmid stability protein